MTYTSVSLEKSVTMVSLHVLDNGSWFSFGEVTISPARLLRIIYPIRGIMTIPHRFFSVCFSTLDRCSPPFHLTNVVCGCIFLRSVYCTKKVVSRGKTPLKMQKLCHCASFLSMPHFLLTNFYEIMGGRWKALSVGYGFSLSLSYTTIPIILSYILQYVVSFCSTGSSNLLKMVSLRRKNVSFPIMIVSLVLE